MTPDDLKKTLEVLENIVNSTVHPDTAWRAVFVELKPIRREIKRLKLLMEESAEPNCQPIIAPLDIHPEPDSIVI